MSRISKLCLKEAFNQIIQIKKIRHCLDDCQITLSSPPQQLRGQEKDKKKKKGKNKGKASI